MTPVTASPQIPPAREPRFRRCIAVAPPSPNARAASRSRQNCRLHHHPSDKIATAIVVLPPTTAVSPSPTQAAAPPIPHSDQPPTRPPAGSFLGGFRTPAPRARADSYDRPASETLHPCGPPGTHDPRRARRSGSCLARAKTLGPCDHTADAKPLVCTLVAARTSRLAQSMILPSGEGGASGRKEANRSVKAFR